MPVQHGHTCTALLISSKAVAASARRWYALRVGRVQGDCSAAVCNDRHVLAEGVHGGCMIAVQHGFQGRLI